MIRVRMDGAETSHDRQALAFGLPIFETNLAERQRREIRDRL
jgi:hypothetical protein